MPSPLQIPWIHRGWTQAQIDYIICSPQMEKLYMVSKNKTGS